MKPYYTVGHGCNSRHLLDVELFDLLRDAKVFAETCQQAHRLCRHVAEHKYSTSEGITCTVISEKVI